MEEEIKALLVKFQTKEERVLNLLKVSGESHPANERLSGQAQILNEVIWDLQHLLNKIPSPEAKVIPVKVCKHCGLIA